MNIEKFNLKSVAVFAVLVVSLFMGVVLVQRQQETRREAAGGPVVPVLIPTEGAKAAGDSFQVQVKLTSSVLKRTQTAGVDIAFDPNVFTVSNITCSNEFSYNLSSGLVDGKIRLSCATGMQENAPVVAIGPNNTPTLGSFTLTVKQGAISGLSRLSFSRVVVSDMDTYEDVAGEGMGAGFTISGGETSKLYGILVPSSDQKRSGDAFSVELKARNTTGVGYEIRTVSATLAVGSEFLEVEDFVCSESFPTRVEFVKTAGDFMFSCAQTDGSRKVTVSPNSTVSMGTVRLKVKQTTSGGQATVCYSSTDIPESSTYNNLGGVGSSCGECGTYSIAGDVTPIPTATTTPTPISTVTPIPTVTTAPTPTTDPAGINIDFKVKFVAVDTRIPSQNVRAEVRRPSTGGKWTFDRVPVIADANGVLSGRVSLPSTATIGGGYEIIIKGPKHLANKYCQDGQTQRCSFGQYITLAKTNSFDFTGYRLEPGDIPNASGVQDGRADTADFAILKMALSSTDRSLRDRANLNYAVDEKGEPVINTHDITLFLLTMGRRYDDDN